VEEKERLLREIHHRVKNNLQIVMSLLNSQSAYLENNQAIEAIRESQQRIHSISLIHQKLYQSEGAAIINMDSYIRELVEYLQSSFNTGLNIRFDLQIEPIQLDVTQAVPVGLILNEAISNAIKYAFPGKNEGLVRISMQGQSANRVVLIVQDNGVGLKSGFDIDQSKSLGMTLMRGLSEQLNGHFILKNDNGLAICCDFEISDALE
jgi:two-component sensor histidine kinase